MKQKNKRRIFKYVIRYFRSQFVRKFINWKRILRAGSGNEKENNKGKGILRAGTGNKKRKRIARAGTGKEWDL